MVTHGFCCAHVIWSILVSVPGYLGHTNNLVYSLLLISDFTFPWFVELEKTSRSRFIVKIVSFKKKTRHIVSFSKLMNASLCRSIYFKCLKISYIYCVSLLLYNLLIIWTKHKPRKTIFRIMNNLVYTDFWKILLVKKNIGLLFKTCMFNTRYQYYNSMNKCGR